MFRKPTPGLILASLLLLALAPAAWQLLRVGPAGSTAIQQLSGYTMGTGYSIQLAVLPAGFGRRRLADSLQSMLDHLDRDVFSTYAEQSELTRFNRSPVNKPFAASSNLLDVVAQAGRINHLTMGAFDMTVAPLVNLWGFGPDPVVQGIPAQAQIDTALARLGSDAVEVSPDKGVLIKHQDVQLDLSAIAKGYAVDQVAAWLDSLHLDSYLVEIGGEIRTRGVKPGGQPWHVAIERPRSGERSAYLSISSRGANLAIAGSGDYRNFFELNGQRYSHEIDPRTGWPVRHGLASVTVVDTSAARADAMATALMVLGPEQGYALANSLHLAVYFIMRGKDGLTSRYTEAFARLL